MESFLTGANLVWIVGILSSIIAGLNALAKYRYEKKLEQFKETNINLFKKEKEEVLAAISTLSVFKKDPRFEQHTINVLLSRLYTELDYDITNAICSTLIQYSNRQELLDISSEILDINRNFFVQSGPVTQMVSDLDRNWVSLSQAVKEKQNGIAPAVVASDTAALTQKKDMAEQHRLSASEPPSEIEKEISEDLLNNYRNRSMSWIPKKRYELLWHKQITADTYSRILRRAYYSKPNGWGRLWQRYYRLMRAKGKTHRFKELDMNFYQNDFNYAYMADFNTSSCSLAWSAISSAVLVDVGFNNISRISGTTFEGSKLYNCKFRGGSIDAASSFKNCKFYEGCFEDVLLKDVDFYGSDLNDFAFRSRMVREDVKLQMIRTSFNYSLFNKCVFKNCVISHSAFASCAFINVVFENVVFEETYFCNSNFTNVEFRNCQGLSSHHFYKYKQLDDQCKMPAECNHQKITELQKEEMMQHISSSALSSKDKEYLQAIV